LNGDDENDAVQQTAKSLSTTYLLCMLRLATVFIKFHLHWAVGQRHVRDTCETQIAGATNTNRDRRGDSSSGCLCLHIQGAQPGLDFRANFEASLPAFWFGIYGGVDTRVIY
jgi:hypothetical protein